MSSITFRRGTIVPKEWLQDVDTLVYSGTVATGSTTRRTLPARSADQLCILDFGGAGDNSTDNLAAWNAAQAALPESGGTIYFPRGVYYFSDNAEMTKCVHVLGEVSSEFTNWGSVCRFAVDKTGFIINRHNTYGYTTVANSTYPGAYHALIENVAVVSDGYVSNASADGIFMRTACTIRNVLCRGFKRNGIRIEASLSSGGATEGNDNLWRLHTIRLISNGGDGLYVAGNDANVGHAIGVDSSSNGGWGINDVSAFGNTYVACHASNNTSGSFRTTGLSAFHVFLGCYSELGQPAASFTGPTVTIGGLHNAGINADATQIFGGSNASNFSGPISTANNVSLATEGAGRAVSIGTLSKPTTVATLQHLFVELATIGAQNSASGEVDFGYNFYYNGGFKSRVNDVALRISFNVTSGEIAFWHAPAPGGADTALVFTKQFSMNSSGLQLVTKTPSSATATGTAGTIAWDSSYIYICTAANTWKRVAIATW